MTSAEAARLAGVGPTAIKRWADSDILKCVRTPGGHRRFERAVVERFLLNAAGGPGEGHRWDGWIDDLIQDGRAQVLQARLLGERATLGAWHLVAADLGRLLEELGERWCACRLTVLEEHLASARLQRALAGVVESLPLAPTAPRCLLACAEGDDHTLGLSLVELCLREAGWQCEWAGSRTRLAEIVEGAASGRIGMVTVSASAYSSDADALESQARALASACAIHRVSLVLGGGGAWPDEPAGARRFRELTPFYEYAVEAR